MKGEYMLMLALMLIVGLGILFTLRMEEKESPSPERCVGLTWRDKDGRTGGTGFPWGTGTVTKPIEIYKTRKTEDGTVLHYWRETRGGFIGTGQEDAIHGRNLVDSPFSAEW